MAKSEDIEAKLAAYVDGQLDAADRAEIEKHLAEHPQHRQLIAELMQHKQLLKNLPREHAPADVAEAINAQLERAVLLGDIDDDSHAAAMRIGRGPQMRAIAAVLLLTASLAAVIYYLLPSPSRKPPQLADLRTLPTTEPANISPPPEMEMDQAVNVDSPATQPSEALAKAAAETDQERRARLALDGAEKDKDGFAGNVGNERLFRNALNDQIKAENPPVGSGPIVIVIPTADPLATNQQVTDYLTNNKISWQTSAEPMPPPLGLQKSLEVAASKLQQTSVEQQTPTSAPAWRIVSQQLESSPTPMGQTGQFIVARQLPRQEALDLSDALTTLATHGQSETEPEKTAATQPAGVGGIFKDESLTKVPTTQEMNREPSVSEQNQPPATQPRQIVVGDTLDIRVPQLVGPGIEPQSTQRVAGGGTVALPMLDPVPVAGMSETQAADAIALKYRDAKLIPNATPTVSIATTQPTTQTTSLAAQSPSTAPASQPSRADLVDVVIVLKKQSASPSTQPTTEPATQPMPQSSGSPMKK
ncbi:MAG TPA: polysaccharide biosynthesis/export family protein [Tepidisphaeraceae bacterium]